MNNLYVFAIGGSGERIMKSLVMMLTAGMSVGAKKIIPVFVDNDVNSNALTTCLDVINYYRANPATDRPTNGEVGLHTICSKFQTPSKKVASFAHVDIGEPVILNVAGGQIGTLDHIIGQLNQNDIVERSISEEKNLLFTDNDLQMPLTVGFVGNPNVGSVVLNSLSLHSDGFETILGNAGQNDGVFVIGSLFGGTGAAGFPLIINKFHGAPVNPLLGGVAVLPYFNIQQGDGTAGLINTQIYNVNSDTFSAKTRAALMYYDEYMRNMHYMYYVGDDGNRSLYKHFVGGAQQKNPYNIIEVMAAMSIVNFSKQDAANKPNNVVYKMPKWSFDDDTGTISNISNIPNKDLKRALVKFQMMKELFENNSDGFIKWAIEHDQKYVHDIKFDQQKLNAVRSDSQGNLYPMAWALRHLFQEWDLWMNELSCNSVKRKMKVFDKNDVTIDNMAQKFYSDNEYGIAKTEVEIKIFTRKKITKIVKTDVANVLLNSFSDLKFSLANALDEDALGKLLLNISEALDQVIDKNCAL